MARLRELVTVEFFLQVRGSTLHADLYIEIPACCASGHSVARMGKCPFFGALATWNSKEASYGSFSQLATGTGTAEGQRQPTMHGRRPQRLNKRLSVNADTLTDVVAWLDRDVSH